MLEQGYHSHFDVLDTFGAVLHNVIADRRARTAAGLYPFTAGFVMVG